MLTPLPKPKPNQTKTKTKPKPKPEIKKVDEGGGSAENKTPPLPTVITRKTEETEKILEQKIEEYQKRFHGQRTKNHMCIKVTHHSDDAEVDEVETVFRNLTPVILGLWTFYLLSNFVLAHTFNVCLFTTSFILVSAYSGTIFYNARRMWQLAIDKFMVFCHTVFLAFYYVDQGIQYARNWVEKPTPFSVKKVSKRAAAIFKLRKSRENSFQCNSCGGFNF